MFAFWAFGAAFIAAAGAFDPESDLEAFPDLQRGLLKYRRHQHRHLRAHHPHHHMALAHHHAQPSAPRMEWHPDDNQAQPVVVGPPMALPGRHPSVEKALSGMSDDLQALKEVRDTAKNVRGELEGKVSSVVKHMNDAMSIKHAIAQTESKLRMEKRKLMELDREGSHIEETHSSLVSSLHRVLEPKLMFARERLGKKEMLLEREEQAAKGWQAKKDQIHEHALELLKMKQATHQSLAEAENEVAEAKKKEEAARTRYERSRQATSEEVQSFRYAETRLKAELTHEKAAAEATTAAKESVQKLNHVLEVESEKVEESMTVNKNRIRRKMHETEAVREHTKEELANLEHKYHEWQENQRMRAAEVVKKGQDTAAASEAFADRQQQVLETAQNKVVHDAQANSDWADEDGFSDPTPSLSD